MTREKKTASRIFISENPEFFDNIMILWESNEWMSLEDAAERVWKKVNFFGRDYKTKNIQSRTLVGSCDYDGQGNLTVMWDADNFSFDGNPFDSFLFLRNPDAKD